MKCTCEKAWVPCYRCNDTGVVSVKQRLREFRGDRLRRFRRREEIYITEACRLTGLSDRAFYDIEMGRVGNLWFPSHFKRLVMWTRLKEWVNRHYGRGI